MKTHLLATCVIGLASVGPAFAQDAGGTPGPDCTDPAVAATPACAAPPAGFDPLAMTTLGPAVVPLVGLIGIGVLGAGGGGGGNGNGNGNGPTTPTTPTTPSTN